LEVDSIQVSQGDIPLRIFSTQENIPDPEFSDADSDFSGPELDNEDQESFVAHSADGSDYRRKKKGKAQFVSHRQYLLYVMAIQTGGWNQAHWLWWSGKLAQKWVLTQYNKLFNERASYLTMVAKNTRWLSIPPADMVAAYQHWLNNWAINSKYYFLNNFVIIFNY
jgi:hypothetical protein